MEIARQIEVEETGLEFCEFLFIATSWILMRYSFEKIERKGRERERVISGITKKERNAFNYSSSSLINNGQIG